MPNKPKEPTISVSSDKTSKPSVPPLHASKQLIDVDNVSVRFGNEAVLQDISFCVHQGEFVGLIGPNGAGKTTLLRVLLGLLHPSTGRVTAQKGIRIGYVPQRGTQYSAIVPMSALEVVRLGAGGSRTRALQTLETVGMAKVAAKRITELSGGQQQRVLIAKALASGADVLMLDEPTTGIDEHAQADFYALLQGLQQQGMTIVMVSHDVDAVLRLVTRVICLNRTIVYDGAPEHFEADRYMPAEYKAMHRQLHHHHQGGAHA